VARIVEAPQAKRGDSSVNGRSAVVLTIQKQPDADTRQLTAAILAALEDLQVSLPPDVVLEPTYQQREFIDLGVANVVSALRDGSVLVAVVLLLFLLNLRTTLITLLVIPLSMAITAIIFYQFDLGINVMTLGGLAVGLGMLVDDAIVGVENAYRRLRQRLPTEPQTSAAEMVFQATHEVLGAIVISTLIVVVVFAPLLFLSGMEGRLFAPLAIAYLVSICASTLVALTVTPALSLLLLPGSLRRDAQPRDSWLVAGLKWIFRPWIRVSLHPVGLGVVLLVVAIGFVSSLGFGNRLGRDFLPAFDEGATQVNLYSAPGTALETMVRISQVADQRFERLRKSATNPQAPLLDFTCKLGRAEQDEHVMGVNVAEYVLTLNPESNVPRAEMIRLLTEAVEDLPGIEHEIEQPIAHLISHMLSGVAAQIAIKIQGDDLDVLRLKGEEIRRAIESIPGIADPFVEQQQIVPQMQWILDYAALADHGLPARDVTDLLETAIQGRVVSQLTDGQRYFDIVVRMEDEYRLDLDQLGRLPIETSEGKRVLLSSVAQIRRGGGPNTINRENARRRLVVRVNTLGGDLSGVVAAIRTKLTQELELPPGYFLTYGGQFEARQSAESRIFTFSLLSILLVVAILYSAFPSLSVVCQILGAIPAAFIGGIAGLVLTQQSLSIAALVGFVSLAGVATRNGLLLIGTYQAYETEGACTKDMIIRGSLDRLAPVLMSSLTTGLGLLPLLIGGTQPGKEILYPVATVIVGGLVTSTLCEFLVRPGLYWWLRPVARPAA
jgi:CzcA family heavy metal efflux pump